MMIWGRRKKSSFKTKAVILKNELKKNDDFFLRPQIIIQKESRMFTDYTKIIIKAGDGGNGATSFRREKYVAAGRT